MTVVAIVQARMSSTRLPGKVLLPILGKPMLAFQIERIRRAEALDLIVVATSDGDEDAPIVDLCQELGVVCFRGSLHDVLDRCYRAGAIHGATHVARLTGDCPLTDWIVIDATVRWHISGGYAYTANTLKRTWPRGLDVEVVTFASLETAWREAHSNFDREHVLPYIWQRPDRFRLGSVTNDDDLSAKRWTVDEIKDFKFVSRVYERLYPDNPAFDTDDILALLSAYPDVEKTNAGVTQDVPPPGITSNP